MPRSALPVQPKENSAKWALLYINAVMNDKIPVCHWATQAVNRHVSDLKKLKRYYFDEGAADEALSFFYVPAPLQRRMGWSAVYIKPVGTIHHLLRLWLEAQERWFQALYQRIR